MPWKTANQVWYSSGLQRPDASQLCQRLRDTAVGAITPVIMMGAPGADIVSVADALAIGADFYFDAPWQDDAVLVKVKTYVGEGGVPVVDAPPMPEHDPTAAAASTGLRECTPAAPQNTMPAALPKLPLPAEPATDLTSLLQPQPLRLQHGPPPRRPSTVVAALVPCDTGSWDAAPPSGQLDPICHVGYVLAQAWAAQATGAHGLASGRHSRMPVVARRIALRLQQQLGPRQLGGVLVAHGQHSPSCLSPAAVANPTQCSFNPGLLGAPRGNLAG